MEKGETRKAMREKRRAVPPEAREAASRSVCERVMERDDVREAIERNGIFAVYLASAEELELDRLIGMLWEKGCKVAVPAWRGGEYALVRYARDTELKSGKMGIREPVERDGESVAPADVAVWIVPGLAFTRTGCRLGYGGGWYDRFLSAAADDAVAIGVAYGFQVVAELPREPHDIALSGVVAADCAGC